MPKGIPQAGYRKTSKYKARTVQEIEKDLQNKAPGILAELEKLTKPFECPHCGNEIKIIDKEVGMYLVDHAIGRSKSRTELDVTHNIQLSADDVMKVIASHPILSKIYALAELIANYPEEEIVEVLEKACQIAQRALLPEAIEGEYKEI